MQSVVFTIIDIRSIIDDADISFGIHGTINRFLLIDHLRLG
jgi:hypothetical protein